MTAVAPSRPNGSRAEPTAWRAVVGRLRLQEKGGQERTVVEVVVHEGYRRVEGGHDLALARLESPVTLGPRVGTICLPQARHPFAFGTPCWITGWGHVAENGEARTPGSPGVGGLGPRGVVPRHRGPRRGGTS